MSNNQGQGPLKGPCPEGKATVVGEQPYRDLGLSSPLLGKARLAEAVGAVGLEVQGRDVEQDQSGLLDPGMAGQHS